METRYIRDTFCATSLLLMALSIALGVSELPNGAFVPIILVIPAVFAWRGCNRPIDAWVVIGGAVLGAFVIVEGVHQQPLVGRSNAGLWIFLLAIWALAWRGIDRVANYSSLITWRQRLADIAVPIAFGLWLLFLWEAVVVGLSVPQVLLPPPSMIGVKFAASLSILWADFVQTFLKAVVSGYILGCGSGLLVAVLIDRVPFLQRGLMPIGNMASALPIVGVAPIMVMWFGFDWPSKTAVVVIMTFFPMLVNARAGLGAAGRLEEELLASYGATYWQTLLWLRIPASLPFVFNALKINSTLALIGAIVAEFFGTPIVGMGFRISTEVGRMNVDMVWAEILVAAIAGSMFYGIMTLLERYFTFWHPSYRKST
ncbi:MAG: ABC transporter permease [Rhodospirillales bacterium]|jgi:NitT/TauT family transport system permease protein|nr:ABC transporter permease [Rhodospirillales bacterium]MBT4038844.1 ABC transporter permease [Rhodospirillales bacterium]MBT4627581.1 ABC transporter permease [Rhodospirillales bacterium]MBT5351785.1 ABC transporter permease [Rhodospirillales bacterium]MBT5521653.1 ABC transporter permease [Rhodospirillales bacterium]